MAVVAKINRVRPDRLTSLQPVPEGFMKATQWKLIYLAMPCSSLGLFCVDNYLQGVMGAQALQ